jgi:hypothetical protein
MKKIKIITEKQTYEFEKKVELYRKEGWNPIWETFNTNVIQIESYCYVEHTVIMEKDDSK